MQVLKEPHSMSYQKYSPQYIMINYQKNNAVFIKMSFLTILKRYLRNRSRRTKINSCFGLCFSSIWTARTCLGVDLFLNLYLMTYSVVHILSYNDVRFRKWRCTYVGDLDLISFAVMIRTFPTTDWLIQMR